MPSSNVLLLAVAAQALACGHALAAPFSPHLALDFGLSAKQLAKACRQAVGRAESALQAVVNLPPEARALSNTPEAVEAALSDLAEQTAGASFLRFVSTSTSVRQAGRACRVRVERARLETFGRADLYDALRGFEGRTERLAGESRRLLEAQLRDFRRGGAGLPAKDAVRLAGIREELAGLERTFLKNIAGAEADDAVAVSSPELAGLPPGFIAGLQREDGSLRVGAGRAQFAVFMARAKRPEARQLLDSLHGNLAAKANLPVLERMLDLRQAAAKLVGCRDHAACVLEGRMLGSVSAVTSFLYSLESGLSSLADAELKALAALKDDEEGREASDRVIHGWDWRYYEDQVKRARCGIEEDALAAQFPVEAVVDGMFELARRLYKVEFRRVPAAASWHPGVALIEVADAGMEAGRERPALGYLYLDLGRREGKPPGAFAHALIRPRRLGDGRRQPAVTALVASIEPRPGLLSPGELGPLLREFGRALHLSLSSAKYARLSAADAPEDFADVAGVVFEHWAWTDAGLEAITRRRQGRPGTAVVLPGKLRLCRDVPSGLAALRQVALSMLDIRYHSAGITDTTEEYERLAVKFGRLPMTPGTHPQAGLRPLAGQAVGIYAALWAEVLGADLFSRFESGGSPDPILGPSLRELVLEPGAGRDPEEQARAFLGRKPGPRAFLEYLGAVKRKKKV
ncbi:MAG: hypothetical protein HY927_15900 [Elusimicrobia bacterium]|nr:hypothetical protein [Elusimicrobiota bacterium]